MNSTTEIIARKKYLDELNESTGKLMGFKKVHWFMGKIHIQRDEDPPNMNTLWSPTTNANDAMQIMHKYGFTLTRSIADDDGTTKWECYSIYAAVRDADPLIAICKSLIAHAELG